MTRRKAILPIIVLIAAALRFHALGAKSLWFDEIISVRRARGTFVEMIREVAGHDGHPPLYYALQYAARALGTGEAAARVPSALAGIVLVYVVYRIARKMLGEYAGLAAAGLCALSAFQVYFSQEARPYSLAMLLAAISFWLFLRILDQPPDNSPSVLEAGPEGASSERSAPATLHWIMYTAVAVAMLYTYYYLLFALLAEGVVLVLCHRRARPIIRQWLLSRIVAAILFVPYLPVIFSRMAGLPPAPEQSRWELPASMPAAFARMLTGIDLAWLRPGAALTVVIYAAAFVPVVAALVLLRKNRFALAAALSYVLIPVVSVVILPWRLQIFEAKHLAFVSPMLLILGVYAGARFRCRPAAWAGAGLLVLLNIFALSGYFEPSFKKERWPDACSFVAENAQPGDAITFNPKGLQYAFEHYYHGRKLILVQDAATLSGKAQFDRLWLIEASNSNVAIPDRRVTAMVRQTLQPRKFPHDGLETNGVVLHGYKGNIAVSLHAPAPEPKR